MSFEADGQVVLDETETLFRYRVRVWQDALTIWLEDRTSKAQWQTVELKTKDFVVEDNMIPRADIVGYAQRFANALGVLETENQSEYQRSLSTVDKNGARHLQLAIQLHVGGFETQLEYDFVLMPVALERVDVLTSQVRDLSEELERLQTQIDEIEDEKRSKLDKDLVKMKQAIQAITDKQEARRELAYVQLTASNSANQSQTLKWTISSEGYSHFSLSSKGDAVICGSAGLFMIMIHLQHDSSNQGTVFALNMNGTSVEKYSSYNRSGYANTSSYTTVRSMSKGDKLSIVYRGNNTAYDGSSMTIVELRRD
ncbi:hypothetical protein Poli38472_013657 [Pythium oligandrum]|uniref:Uncharacterized protein n=1 Tax=Pythium oligandrum TaxID=41045 RepID=A0A8K1CD41_PYTOL|nr:hypothetical protein Poli38472_013657 [Pythium oligandrum]|eukprot:TMW61194.1 hypothetical protein Poli38472_013657 [Pythium oligandrum]